MNKSVALQDCSMRVVPFSTGWVSGASNGDEKRSLLIARSCNFAAPTIMVILGLKMTMVSKFAKMCWNLLHLINILVRRCHNLLVNIIHVFRNAHSFQLVANNSMYIATFFYLADWLLYTGSAVIGFGAALIWTAQGNFLTINSTKKTMSRNSGIFWAMLECSLLIGNTFAYFQFTGLDDIDSNTRNTFVLVLLIVGVVGTVVFLFLLPTPWAKDILEKNKKAPLDALFESFALFKTAEMLQLTFYFFYMGMQVQSHRFNAYSLINAHLVRLAYVLVRCIWDLFRLYFELWRSEVYAGASRHFGNVHLHDARSTGLIKYILQIGAGEIVSGLIFGIFGKVTNKLGRWPVVVLGTALQFIAFILIIFNIPNNAYKEGTREESLIFNPPSEALALVCSFTLGFGDACVSN